jgi:multimeric flavodoxin WrbA
MRDVNVVVIFQSKVGLTGFASTEQLALAAAVGAVQGRANIRLRRLPDAAISPAANEGTTEYVAPRESDAVWADAIIVGMPAGPGSLSIGFERYFHSLDALRRQGKLEGKIGASFTQGFEAEPLMAAMRHAGLTTLPEPPETRDPAAPTAARLQGRRVAEAVRARRAPSNV